MAWKIQAIFNLSITNADSFCELSRFRQGVSNEVGLSHSLLCNPVYASVRLGVFLCEGAQQQNLAVCTEIEALADSSTMVIHQVGKEIFGV